MKTVGIIAEYNPFHNGHFHQLHELRSRTGADFVVAAMSGDFVQRGEPAIYDKYTRTRMALSAGVDLVLELPVCFATGSAEGFAACGVALLDRLGVVDILGFGSESGDMEKLSQTASVLIREPEDYSSQLRTFLRQGMSFPKARAAALNACDPDALLASPNNILGVEYLKALGQRNSSIKPVTIRRAGQGYHETSPVSQDVFASASAIRSAIRDQNFPVVHGQVPGAVFALLEHLEPVFPDDLTPLLNARLLDLSHTGGKSSFSDYADMSPELASRLGRDILNFATFSGRIMQLKTRSYTYTRISRALLHLLLGITAEQASYYKNLDYVCYARILGFRRQAAPLLSRLKRTSSLPLVTKTANAPKILNRDALSLLQMDFHASHLYQSLIYAKSGRLMPNEYTRSVIVL